MSDGFFCHNVFKVVCFKSHIGVLCGRVVKAVDYESGGPGFDPPLDPVWSWWSVLGQGTFSLAPSTGKEPRNVNKCISS